MSEHQVAMQYHVLHHARFRALLITGRQFLESLRRTGEPKNTGAAPVSHLKRHESRAREAEEKL